MVNLGEVLLHLGFPDSIKIVDVLPPSVLLREEGSCKRRDDYRQQQMKFTHQNVVSMH